MTKIDITAQRLRELLHYEPETGLFTRVFSAGGGLAGSVAGFDKSGYVKLRADHGSFFAHRAAFLWMTNEWPSGVVDHIDGDTSNNRWVNLRDVPQLMNMQNIKRAYRSNKLGLLGVVKQGSDRPRAQIRVNGKVQYLGSFETPELAHAAYIKAKRLLHAGNTI